MLFIRSIPPRVYADYARYRPLLRRDFQYRCAYCLTHEYYFGGEAGGAIDHHRPQNGAFARPDLASVYENLYWTCSECNQNKSDTWPSPAEFDSGFRFLDPCHAGDDHDLHVAIADDGTATPLTNTGRYTIEKLVLWRKQLVYHRARCLGWQREYDELSGLLDGKQITPDVREVFAARLAELRELITPPVFDRSRRK